MGHSRDKVAILFEQLVGKSCENGGVYIFICLDRMKKINPLTKGCRPCRIVLGHAGYNCVCKLF